MSYNDLYFCRICKINFDIKTTSNQINFFRYANTAYTTF